MNDCVFCKIIKGEIPSKKLAENDQAIAIMSLENHPLVITKTHFENIYTLDENTGAAIMKLGVKIANAVKEGLKADGVKLFQNNGVAAGQDVFHYHLHIDPKWSEETQKFNPEETFEKIKASLD